MSRKRCGIAVSMTISAPRRSSASASAAPSWRVCHSACAAKKASSKARTCSCSSGRLLEDIAGEPETAHPQFVAVCLEEAWERVDEVKQHVVHVEHQQRARVEREFLDLAQR